MDIAISILFSLTFYTWTIFGLPKLVLKPESGRTYNVSSFKEEYPYGKQLVLIHAISSFLAFFCIFLGGILFPIIEFGDTVASWVAMWFVVAGWNLYNGMFEVLTSVSPKYGILIKRHQAQIFYVDRKVKRLGVIRLLFSVLIILIVLIFVIDF